MSSHSPASGSDDGDSSSDCSSSGESSISSSSTSSFFSSTSSSSYWSTSSSSSSSSSSPSPSEKPVIKKVSLDSLVLQNKLAEIKSKRSVSTNEEDFQPPPTPESMFIFQREIYEKDRNDPTYGDGYEIEEMFGVLLIRGVLHYRLKWRKGIHYGVGVLDLTTIQKKWPEVADRLFRQRFSSRKRVYTRHVNESYS